MMKHERDAWIELLKQAGEAGKWGDPKKCRLCRFAGLIWWGGDKSFEAAYCPKCIISRYAHDNYAELRKHSKAFEMISPKKHKIDYEQFEEFGFFISPCLIVGWINREGEFKPRAKYRDLPPEIRAESSPSDYLTAREEKENIAYWSDRMIRWLKKRGSIKLS